MTVQTRDVSFALPRHTRLKMSMSTLLGSAKSGFGSAKLGMVDVMGKTKDVMGKTKSGMTAMVGSAKVLAQNLKGKADELTTPTSPANSSPAGQVRSNARELLRDLIEMFPGWDEQAIKEVIINSKGNRDVCIDTITAWTADDDGTSKAAIREQEEKANIVSEDFIPPPVEERVLLDTVLEKRLTSEGQDNKKLPATTQALNMMKAFAKTAQQTVRKHTGGSFSPSVSSETPTNQDLEFSREQKIEQGTKLLHERLGKWKLTTLDIVDDGNCQFRAFSFELFGTEAFHLAVRATAVHYLREHQDEYAAFVPEAMTWEQYLEAMSKPRYWGDQLTLMAACQAYGCTVHMISTEQENWQHAFEPDEKKWPYRRVFLAYISPIHYSVIQPVQ